MRFFGVGQVKAGGNLVCPAVLNHLGNDGDVFQRFFMESIRVFGLQTVRFKIAGRKVFYLQLGCDFLFDLQEVVQRFGRVGIFVGRHSFSCQQYGGFTEIGKILFMFFRRRDQFCQFLMMSNKIIDLRILRFRNIGIDIGLELLACFVKDFLFIFRGHFAVFGQIHTFRRNQFAQIGRHLIKRQSQLFGRNVIVHLQKIFDITR